MELDYDKAIHLDAEELAEQGIAEAYTKLLPELKHHVHAPLVVREHLNSDLPSYEVVAGSRHYKIYPSPHGGDEYEGWGNATYALFAIVNAQLQHSSVRFYAINSGNDLFGIFLTPAEAKSARHSLPRRQDWPYLPTDTPPWFGQEN
ncbi:hypothetical protein [Xanthomonas sp. fls2-241-TYG-148]|uniref:hypothetical protein n=1 Tax=Xanthomonas sp. fls2-241-TYG-148 TaxID=3040328 RepID=UPI00255395E1|nr:hypothetical protein [Xanthomonas sp. fls2-241-TYG-148]